MVGMDEPIGEPTYQDQEFNGQVLDQQMPEMNQQPTGGMSPGNFIEE